MPLTLADVEYFADLARLDLLPAEKESLRQQLSAILEYFSDLQAADTEAVSPTASILPAGSRLREDEPSPGLSVEELLRNAPETEQNQFRVPPVFE